MAKTYVNIGLEQGAGGGGGAVDSVNGKAGSVTIAAGTNVTIDSSGSTIVINSSGGGSGNSYNPGGW